MNTEYEVRVLEINIDEMIQKLESLNAEKIGEWNQKRYVYDMIPKSENAWLRLRTNGTETTLTYKNVEKNTIDGTKELEIVVSDFEKTNDMLELMCYHHKGYQENKRIRYMLNDVEIDLDTWPLIPTYMEIEGKNEQEVNDILLKLDIPKDKITALNCQDIYREIYHIDIDNIKELSFK